MDLQSAADRLGVHYQTAYRWVRDGSLEAVKRGSVYEVSDEAVEAFRQMRLAPAAPPRQTQVRSWEHQVERLAAVLLEGDELGARQVVDRLSEGGIAPTVLCEELFVPVLREIGRLWAAGEISVAHEHRASAICERLLARMAVHPRGRPRGICVVATVPGEEHGLPAVMATVALRADRWQVHHLGTQVPTADLVDLALALRADLVVLSSTNPAAQPDARAIAEQIRREMGARVLLGEPGMRLGDLVVAARDPG